MAVTLGALLCVLTLAYLLLLKPLPYPHEDKLFMVNHGFVSAQQEFSEGNFPYPGLIDLYNKQTQFSDTALVFYTEDAMTSLPLQPVMDVTYTTPKLLELIDMPVFMGRRFSDKEAKDTLNPVAVISHQTWQNQFGGDPAILNEKVSFKGLSFSIVGVTAPSFIEPQLHEAGRLTDVWLPWDFNPTSQRNRKRWTSNNEALVFVGGHWLVRYFQLFHANAPL